jgi:hypothetical protein
MRDTGSVDSEGTGRLEVYQELRDDSEGRGNLLETADTVLAARRIKKEVIGFMIGDFDVLWGYWVGCELGNLWLLSKYIYVRLC